MFNYSFTKKQDKPTDSVQAMDASSSMDTTDDSFVHIIDESSKPALTLTITPLYDSIGIDSDKKSAVFCATVTARNLPDDDDSNRAPADIVVALDVSGSMCGSKLNLCKVTQNLLLRELGSSDRFGLVSFGSDAKVEIVPRKLTQVNKDFASKKVESLSTRGCTNMSGGIGLAAEEIRSIDAPHDVQAVFLLTDGQANEGISDKEGIVKLTKGCLGSAESAGSTGRRTSIPIHCFGYGSGHNSDMLKEISQSTEGGTYYFVDNDSDVSSAFGDALGGVLSVVAQNVRVNLKVPKEATANGVSILDVKHDKAIKNEDGSFSITLTDFYAEESRDIIFEVSLSSEKNSMPVTHVTSSLSYLDTVNSKLVQNNANLKGSIKRPPGNATSTVNNHVSLQCIRIKTTEVIAKAKSLADNGNFDAAKSTIKSMIDELQQQKPVAGKPDPFIVQMLSELQTITSGLSSRASYKAKGGHYMHTRIMTHQYQRCTESHEGSMNVYKSSAKKSWATKMKASSLSYKK